jgi:PAS domain S-box-containing protein
MSSRAGVIAIAAAAIGSVLALNWFLLEPKGTFAIRDLSDWLALAVYIALVIAAVVLVISARRHALEYERGLRRLADEQASLRRVAMLVARGATPAEVFAAVAEEIADILGVPLASVASYEPDGTATLVGIWGRENPFPVGSRYPPHPGAFADVWRTGHPARVDYAGLPGPISAQLSAAGIRSGLGVPIVVDGRTWGVVVALSTERTSLPDDTETRLTGFTELVATAIANAQARDDLRRLADEQAALRRVATLVAREAMPSEVFAAVAEEVQQTLDLPLIVMARYEPDDAIAIIGATGEHPFRTGTRWPLDPGVSSMVLQTGLPAKVNYEDLPGTIAEAALQGGFQTGLGVPIVVDGAIWGVIATVSTAEQPLRDDTEARLADFTELVATAIAKTQARDDLRRLADEQAALRRVATLVAREAMPSEVFAAVAEEAGKLLNSPRVSMVRYESDGTATVIGGPDAAPFPLGSSWPLDGPTVLALIKRTDGPARVDDYSKLQGTVAERVREAGISSAVGVPIVVDRETWGAMIAVAPGSQPLPEDTETRLARFTGLVAVAISNTQTRDDLRRLVEEQAALRAVATLVAHGAAPQEVFAAVAEQVAHLLDVPTISMVRFEPDGTSTAIAVSGDDNPFEAGADFPPYPGVMSEMRQTGRPARLEDYADSIGPTTARLRAAGIRSGVGVPIVVDGAMWGAVIALATGERSLPSGIEERLTSFTELVATAISNVQARDEVLRLVDEQAALRRVATLVAQGAESRAVFEAVCAETGRLIGATTVNLSHFTPDGFDLTIAGWSLHDSHVPRGTRLPLEGDTINALVQRTAAPGRSGLTAREDRFRELVEQLPLVTYVRGIEVHQSNAYVSPQVEALLGYSVEEWESDRGLLERAIHPDDQDRVIAAAVHLRETGEPLRLEYRYIARDGRVVWVYDETHLVRDADGRARGVQGVLIDVTERKEAQAAAKESEERFRAMVADGPSTTFRGAHDADRTMEVVSEAIEQILGYPASDLIDNRVRTFASIIHPDDRGTLPDVIAEGEPYEAQYRIVRPDGSLRWVLEKGTGRRDSEGALRLEGAIFDVTERRRAQDALTESEQNFRSIVEATNEWIWAEDKRAHLTYTNPAVHEMLGYSYEDAAGELAASLRRRGIRSEVGAPVIVEGQVWGALIAGTDEAEPLPPDTEIGLARFAELIATTVSNTEARDDLRRLVDEQMALRRVATLVARGAESSAVFDAVCEETGGMIGAPCVNLAHFTSDGFNLTMAGWSLRDTHVPTGTRLPLEGDTINVRIQQTGAPGRIDSYEDATGELSDVIRRRGIRSEVGAPVIVEGHVWGALIAGWDTEELSPESTEAQLAGFAELIATAISNMQARDDLWRLASEQAALRRVATLVARGAESRAVFDAVCEETGRQIGATSVNLTHFTPDGYSLALASWGLRDTHVPAGYRLPLEGDAVDVLVQRTRAPARVDNYEEASGELAALVRAHGVRSEVGAPVIVEGEVWGALLVGWDTPEPPPEGTELSLAGFAELIATTVSNATTRSELVASRARIVSAADEARRRIERDLHDGTQQRLVSLGMELEAAKAKISAEPDALGVELDRVKGGLEAVLDDVREISRGLHPAMLTRAGLPAALPALARKSSIPVELHVDVNARLAESIEITTYYVVSEALANAAKHSQASTVQVSVAASEEWLKAVIRDDGIGGADPAGGSGLIGLVDRVHALGGKVALMSPPGQGTTLTADLPLTAPAFEQLTDGRALP